MRYFTLIVAGLMMVAACKSSKIIKPKPVWVDQRPVNEQYYIGIGIASKLNNAADYQQIAKKNAINDLVSEIKVTVSSTSVLKQYQKNKEFSQQFESDVKVTALNTIDEFTVVDSWENAENFYIYYRLSKDDYKAAIRRKMMMALEQSESFYNHSQSLSREQFTQSLRLKVKALVALQAYLNEDVQHVENGKSVNMIAMLIESIQSQLLEIELTHPYTSLKAVAGKPLVDPISVNVRYQSDKTLIPQIPLVLKSETGSTLATDETDSYGKADLYLNKVPANHPVQNLKVLFDERELIKMDSMSQILKRILLSFDMPRTSVKLNVTPVKFFIVRSEKNMNKEMPDGFIESVIRKQLVEDGCIFVSNRDSADYVLFIDASAKSEGAIWGNMLTASLDVSLTVTENSSKLEVYKDSLKGIKGYQLNIENAGIESYKNGQREVKDKLYPQLFKAVFGTR
jgi:hypothetical protein